MAADQQRRKTRGPSVRVLLEYFMALLMLFFGFFIIFSEKLLGYDYFEGSWLITGAMQWAIGILFMLYGVFRAYRGHLLDKQSQWRRHHEEDQA